MKQDKQVDVASITTMLDRSGENRDNKNGAIEEMAAAENNRNGEQVQLGMRRQEQELTVDKFKEKELLTHAQRGTKTNTHHKAQKINITTKNYFT